MNPPVNSSTKDQSVSVVLDNGEIFKFSLVDNKNMFTHCFRTDRKFNIEIRSISEKLTIYAMYKRHENLAYLVCAWEKKEEINEEAMNEIISNEKLSYLLN